MINRQGASPKWWQLTLIVPLMLGLLILDKKYLTLSLLGHQFMQAGIVLIVFGLLGWWLYANQAGVQGTSNEDGAWHRLDDLDTDQPSVSFRGNQMNGQMAANRSNATGFSPAAQSASRNLQTRKGTSVRTWLN